MIHERGNPPGRANTSFPQSPSTAWRGSRHALAKRYSLAPNPRMQCGGVCEGVCDVGAFVMQGLLQDYFFPAGFFFAGLLPW